MNETPSAIRTRIGIFGRRNAGKSSILNAITGQNIAIVSDIGGTTTDPVSKAMEILPLGPAVVTDTPGLDDSGELGELRKEKSLQFLRKTDIAVLVVDGASVSKDALVQIEAPLLAAFQKQKLPYVIVVNKCDLLSDERKKEIASYFKLEERPLFASARNGQNIWRLKERIAGLAPAEKESGRLVADLLSPLDLAVLVVPIDAAAPKGRLILPQQQVIRDCLEAGAVPVVAKDTELRGALEALARKPKVVITDSQAFERAAKEVPRDCFLTSFSILFSRYKGNLTEQAKGARMLSALKDGDTVLIAEGCTHHRQCGDIGTQKLPRQMLGFTEKKLRFQFVSGTEFPEDLSEYALIVHCGGCVLNGREMQYRLKSASSQGIPMTNYGIAMAYMHGILERGMEIFEKSSEFH